jgi:hypothetical protein
MVWQRLSFLIWLVTIYSRYVGWAGATRAVRSSTVVYYVRTEEERGFLPAWCRPTLDVLDIDSGITYKLNANFHLWRIDNNNDRKDN